MFQRDRVLAVILFVVVAGCDRTPKIARAQYDPEKSANEAMAIYDADKNGKIDATEMKKSPALVHGLANIDSDRDQCIDETELKTALEAYRSSNVWLRDLSVEVVRKGKPVEGVEVSLIPEMFLTGRIKPAVGITDAKGRAELKTEGQPYPGVQLGLFRGVLSRKDAAGKETLPAKFNVETTLGWEIRPDNRVALTIDLDR